MKEIALFFGFALTTLTLTAEIRTLTVDASLTNTSETITISPLQTIEYKTGRASEHCQVNGFQPSPAYAPWIEWNIGGVKFTNTVGLPSTGNEPYIFATGPASVRLHVPNSTYCNPPTSKAYATFDIQPSAYPPDKALTIGSNSGEVKVTMEESTDLVNWTPTNNGTTYTNTPAARFFRIKMEKVMPPS
ncbi:MAG: hypothetical protein U1F65_10615 [Verrucomicrobiota bacterium]